MGSIRAGYRRLIVDMSDLFISFKNESDLAIAFIVHRETINGRKVLGKPPTEVLEPNNIICVLGADPMTVEFIPGDNPA